MMNEFYFTRTPCGGVVLLLVLSSLAVASTDGADFEFSWRFCRGDFSSAMMPAFDDSSWRAVNLPHDWSVEGPFSAEYASGSGFVPGGIGWYRKRFTVDAAYKDKLQLPV